MQTECSQKQQKYRFNFTIVAVKMNERLLKHSVKWINLLLTGCAHYICFVTLNGPYGLYRLAIKCQKNKCISEATFTFFIRVYIITRKTAMEYFPLLNRQLEEFTVMFSCFLYLHLSWILVKTSRDRMDQWSLKAATQVIWKRIFSC